MTFLRAFVLKLLVLIMTSGPGISQIFEEQDGRGIPTIAPIIQGVTDAVVNISVVSEQPLQLNPLFNDPFFRDFFDLPQQLQPQPHISAGSGVIVDAEKGYVLSNAHVIEAATEIVVVLTDGRRLEAEVVGVDPGTDIALLEIEAERLSALPLGNSDALLVGDFVIALGNPFGLGQTVTSGIVSALGRSGINPDGYEDFIQTDASINPGNSGGALVTLDGKLVGINTAIIAPTGGNVGIGFAVPINMASEVVAQLVQFGEVRRGRLGVMIQDLTPELSEALEIDAMSGAIISYVEGGTPAAEAGLAAGDVVVAVNGEAIQGSSDLRNKVGLAPLDSVLEFTVLRAGEEIVITAGIEGDEATIPEVASSGIEMFEGADLGELTEGMPGFGDVEGVAVLTVLPGSPAFRAGLRAGDVIMRVKNEEVTSVRELREAAARNSGSPTALAVYRNGGALYIIVR